MATHMTRITSICRRCQLFERCPSQGKEQQAAKDLEIAKLQEQLEQEKERYMKSVEPQLCAVSGV